MFAVIDVRTGKMLHISRFQRMCRKYISMLRPGLSAVVVRWS